MGDLKTLLFDVDGTLADTEEIHRRAFNGAFEKLGLSWRWTRERYAELLTVTGGKERIRHFIEIHRPEFPRPADMDSFIADLHGAKTEIYTRIMVEDEIPLRPGVRRLLEEARAQGLRLGIATTTTPANVSALLQHSIDPGAPSWFDVIAAGNVVAAKKPAPDIFEYALRELDAPASECIAIEDSENGLRAALGAGIRTLVAVSFYTENETFEGAGLVVDHLGEPDRPFTVRQGDAGGASYVDVALLRRLCR